VTTEATAQRALTERYRGAVMNTFGTPRRVLTRGEGCYVWDADGRRYLDLLAGIAVNALGHAHPAVVAAVTAQLRTLGHVSNVFTSVPQVDLAERLLELVGHPGRVFFTNSGTEANEAALKATRRTGRTRLVSTVGAFHGRSMGALSLTWKPAYRAPFEPLPGEVTFIPYGDVAALEAAVDDETAAFVVEPLQGESGVIPAPAGYLAAAREVTARRGALLWVDEIQTGVGRTGDWLAYTGSGIRPDLVTLAKGLGSGIPVGACLGLGDAGSLLGPGDHGTTFGGNPVACAAGLATLDTIRDTDLLRAVRTSGEHLARRVTELGHPLVGSVRGRGLLRGIELTEPVAPAAVESALDAGYIINATGPTTLRLAPPLVISAGQIDSFVDALPDVLAAARRRGGRTP
jgi:acetylornithine aminotransferase